MGTEICLFGAGKMGFHALGEDKNNTRMGLRFELDSHWDDGMCSWTLGFRP
jgi:hypothetical protein